MRRIRSGLVLLVASLGLLLVLDLTVVPGADTAPDDAPTGAGPTSNLAAIPTGDDAISGRAACAVGDVREGTSSQLELVHPGPVGAAPVRVEAGRTGAEPTTLRTTQLFPSTGATVPLDGEGEDDAGVVSWQDAPLTVARRWRIDDAEDLPPGTAAGPCPVSTAPTSWTLPGVSTTGGTEALLRLVNPHATGATVAVRFLTPEGPEAPTRLRNLSVGAGGTSELSLNEFIPERSDVTVVVEVLSGRVAVEGVQLARAAVGDIDGVSLVQAATEPSQTWTVPWLSDQDDRAPWMWVANDDDRTARVELTVHDQEGGLPAEGLSEVEIPPRTVRRIDLRGVLPEDGPAAVTVRSDGVPVTASGAVEIAGDDPEDTGLVVQRGAAAADPAWTLTGGSTEDRRHQLRLVNPTAEAAQVDGTLWDGSGAEQPDELAGLEVPAGAVLSVDLEDLLGDADRWAITLRARSGEIVAGSVEDGDPSGAAHFVAGIGTPSSEWRTLRDPLTRRAPGTVQRLGTVAGIVPRDPFLAPEGEEAETDPLEPEEVPGAPVVPEDPGDGPDEAEDAEDADAEALDGTDGVLDAEAPDED